MSVIEPNLYALGWFALLWSICCLGFLQIAGMFPLGHQSEDAPAAPATVVLFTTGLWLALVVGTCLFAIAELRWTSFVIAAGILFLFVPELFQAIPARWRNHRAGIATTGLTLAGSLALLVHIGALPIRSLL